MLYVDELNKADPDPIAVFSSKIAGAPGPNLKASIALCLKLWEGVCHVNASTSRRYCPGRECGISESLTVLKGVVVRIVLARAYEQR
jgi:hypothetical protein